MAISEQPIGQWLKKYAPEAFDLVGAFAPELGVFQVIRHLIQKNDMLTPRQRREGLSLLLENENAAVTNRWEVDAGASWLTKNTRPLVVLFVVIIFAVLTVAAGGGALALSDGYFTLWEVALASVVGGYFGLRSLEKLKNRKAQFRTHIEK